MHTHTRTHMHTHTRLIDTLYTHEYQHSVLCLLLTYYLQDYVIVSFILNYSATSLYEVSIIYKFLFLNYILQVTDYPTVNI